MIRIYIALGILAFMASAAYGAKYYYDTTQNKIDQLQKNNATLEVAARSKDLVIEEMTANTKELELLNSELALDLQAAYDYTDSLRSVLQDHDLTRLSLQKPGLIERRVNDGTNNIIGELESLTSN